MIKAVVTFAGVGLIRPAPGTWGSLAAVPTAWLIHWTSGPAGLLFAIVLGFGVGLWATKIYIATTDNHDPSEVVIDEVIGQWIALLPLSIGMGMTGAEPHLFPYPGWIAAFVLFRLFDILKPGPVGSADHRGDALGVMLDDVVAGLFAGLGVISLAAIAHLILV